MTEQLSLSLSDQKTTANWRKGVGEYVLNPKGKKFYVKNFLMAKYTKRSLFLFFLSFFFFIPNVFIECLLGARHFFRHEKYSSKPKSVSIVKRRLFLKKLSERKTIFIMT